MNSPSPVIPSKRPRFKRDRAEPDLRRGLAAVPDNLDCVSASGMTGGVVTASHQIAMLSGNRLHLSQGPIDLVIWADGEPADVARAYRAAEQRFDGLLAELCAELPLLRAPLDDHFPALQGPIARRMAEACWPHRAVFITPMAAVAGAVAEAVLAAMTAAAPLARAYVNDGGDIALHLTPGTSLAIGVVRSLEKAVPEGEVHDQLRHAGARHRHQRPARTLVLARHRRCRHRAGARRACRRRRRNADRQRREYRRSGHCSAPGPRPRSRQRPRRSPCGRRRRPAHARARSPPPSTPASPAPKRCAAPA